MCSRSTCLVDLLVGDPAPAVARDLVAVGQERVDDRRVARERHRDAEDRQRHPALAEEPQDPPHAGARAVLVQRLHRHVPRRKGLRADDLGQESLRRGIAVQHAVLGAFLVVEDELHGDARAARPARVRRRRAVAREVARVVGIERRTRVYDPHACGWRRCAAPRGGGTRVLGRPGVAVYDPHACGWRRCAAPRGAELASWGGPASLVVIARPSHGGGGCATHPRDRKAAPRSDPARGAPRRRRGAPA